ncbi:MAG TPA: hypothetical protein DCR55_10345 [Lentisphaeria bacterium]|jgi:ABC-type transport system involved in multi-copper enzyme maturation permease subunit|nr:hypothetical protein [Lentisphaeria bacterium]
MKAFRQRASALLALLIRDLRDDQRSLQSYIWRAGLLGMVCVFLGSGKVHALYSGAAGLELFTRLTVLNLFALALLTVTSFSSVIAEERADGTLVLLQTADVGWLSLLLCKSTARLIRCALFLLAQLPFALFATLLGGLTVETVFTVYLELLGLVLLLGNLALLCSTVSASLVVCGLAAASVSLFVLAGPALQEVLFVDFESGHMLEMVCPSYHIMELVDGVGSARWGFYFGLSQLAFLMAWAVLARSNGRLEVMPGWQLTRSNGRRRRCWGDFLIWFEWRIAVGGALPLFLPVVPIILGWRMEDINATEWLMISMILFIYPLHVGNVLGWEWRQRTLAVLLTLPISLRSLIWRKLAGRALSMLFLTGILVFVELIYGDGSLCERIGEVLCEEESAIVAISGYVAILHLIFYLSVRVLRWPSVIGLAVGFGVQVGVLWFLIEVMECNDDLTVGILGSVNVLFCLWCQSRLPHVIADAAARE